MEEILYCFCPRCSHPVDPTVNGCLVSWRQMASDRLAVALIWQMPSQIVGADSSFLLWFLHQWLWFRPRCFCTWCCYLHMVLLFASGALMLLFAYGAVICIWRSSAAICIWCCYLHMVLLFADGWWFGSPQEDGCWRIGRITKQHSS